jgi:antitoxin HicB
MTTPREPLAHYLAAAYPFTTVADEGSFFVSFPDLPGCMTQVERIEDVGILAAEILKVWMETAYEQELDIPAPSMPNTSRGQSALGAART